MVRGVVPEAMVRSAKRRINQCIGMARRAAMGYQDLGADRHLVDDKLALLEDAGTTLEALGREEVQICPWTPPGARSYRPAGSAPD